MLSGGVPTFRLGPSVTSPAYRRASVGAAGTPAPEEAATALGTVDFYSRVTRTAVGAKAAWFLGLACGSPTFWAYGLFRSTVD